MGQLARRVRHRLRRRTRRTAESLVRLLNRVMPLQPRRTVFVTRRNVPLTGNLRIVLDALADRGGLELGFFKDGPVPAATAAALQAKGVRVFEGLSPEAARFIASSTTVVLSHSARDAFITHHRRGRRLVNLWHGVALKRIELLMAPRPGDAAHAQRRRLMLRNADLYDACIASSPVDRLVNSVAFGIDYEDVHPVGLPRYDYLAEGTPLPPDLQAQREAIERTLAGRRLVLYAPTFREAGTPFDLLLPPALLTGLRALCERHGLVLGLRPHPYDADRLASLCDGHWVVNFDSSTFGEAALLLAQADALVVDYSSIWVDYLLRERPILGWVPDFDTYASDDRGFIYDQRTLFPGPLVSSGPELLQRLEQLAAAGFVLDDTRRHAQAAAQLLPSATPQGSYTQACVNALFPLNPTMNHSPDRALRSPA